MPMGDSLFYENSTLGLVGEKIQEQNIKEERERSDFRSPIWTLYFDGSKSKEGLGVGCILTDHRGKHLFLSCRLEFECTNKFVEYKSLVQGVKKAIDPDGNELKFFGDSEIIVRQVRNTIHCNSPHLKNYEQEVHRLIEFFEDLNITMIPRAKNILDDSLSTASSRLSPLEDYEAS
jgi:ribonuclease HI